METDETHGTTENVNRYKTLEKEVTARIRNAKRNMEKRLANSNDSNPAVFANHIKSKTKARTGVSPLKQGDGTTVTDEKEMAELLNKFFASVFSIVSGNGFPIRGQETTSRLESLKITREYIREKIKILKINLLLARMVLLNY